VQLYKVESFEFKILRFGNPFSSDQNSLAMGAWEFKNTVTVFRQTFTMLIQALFVCVRLFIYS